MVTRTETTDTEDNAVWGEHDLEREPTQPVEESEPEEEPEPVPESHPEPDDFDEDPEPSVPDQAEEEE